MDGPDQQTLCNCIRLQQDENPGRNWTHQMDATDPLTLCDNERMQLDLRNNDNQSQAENHIDPVQNNILNPLK
jgi:hypothetical protein